MIFICTGSRQFQFNRLLEKVDELVERGYITEEVFAQTAHSNYIPKSYSYKDFLSAEEFSEYQKKADLIISHAGTGALIGALKLGKQVIAVPRLHKYGEHSDDHQLEISNLLANEGYLRQVIDIDDLPGVIELCKEQPIFRKYERPSNIVSIIEEFIQKNAK